jgi:hypothetical protein
MSAGKEEEWIPSPPPPISRISIQVVLAGTLLGGTTQRAGDCMLGASLTFSPTIAPKTTTPTYTLELCTRRRQRRRRGRGRTEGLVETKEFAFGKCCWGGSALGQQRPALYARSNTPLALLTHRHAQLVECVKHVSNSDGLCSHPALGPHAPGNGDGDIVGEVRTKKYKISASRRGGRLSSPRSLLLLQNRMRHAL